MSLGMNSGSHPLEVRQGEPAPRRDELALAHKIQQGDEDAFVRLVCRHQAGFLRLAQTWVHEPTLAEEVVQDTWAVALDRWREFEGRSSITTWLCGILIDNARNRRRKEGPEISDMTLVDEQLPAVPPDRFSPPGHRWDGHWQRPPRAWPDSPQACVLSAELRGLLDKAIARLPEWQRAVLILRDVQRLSSEDVRNTLGVTDTDQRVLLHRARSTLRGLLERHYGPAGSTSEDQTGGPQP
jgi:RNA polymerase sigma-70 factor (ECF subfamily)